MKITFTEWVDDKPHTRTFSVHDVLITDEQGKEYTIRAWGAQPGITIESKPLSDVYARNETNGKVRVVTIDWESMNDENHQIRTKLIT